MVEIKAKEVKIVAIKDIKLNPKNRNKHPKEQIEAIAKVMQYQGFRRPVTISNRSGLLVAGHGRLLAAKQLGLKEVPAIYQDYDSEEQEFSDGISDNSLDKWASLDFVNINNDITDLGPDFDIEVLGIKDFTIDVADKYQEPKEEKLIFILCPNCNEEFEKKQAKTRKV